MFTEDHRYRRFLFTMESLSLILLVPFSVCFLLLFIVCCFADEIKSMCRMPSQLPQHYYGPDSLLQTSRRRHTHARARYEQNHVMTQEDDIESLIEQNDRFRNDSESSTGVQSGGTFNVVAVVSSQPTNIQIVTHEAMSSTAHSINVISNFHYPQSSPTQSGPVT